MTKPSILTVGLVGLVSLGCAAQFLAVRRAHVSEIRGAGFTECVAVAYPAEDVKVVGVLCSNCDFGCDSRRESNCMMAEAPRWDRTVGFHTLRVLNRWQWGKLAPLFNERPNDMNLYLVRGSLNGILHNEIVRNQERRLGNGVHAVNRMDEYIGSQLPLGGFFGEQNAGLSLVSGFLGGVGGLFGVNEAFLHDIELPPKQEELKKPHEEQPGGKTHDVSIGRRFVTSLLLGTFGVLIGLSGIE